MVLAIQLEVPQEIPNEKVTGREPIENRLRKNKAARKPRVTALLRVFTTVKGDECRSGTQRSGGWVSTGVKEERRVHRQW